MATEEQMAAFMQQQAQQQAAILQAVQAQQQQVNQTMQGFQQLLQGGPVNPMGEGGQPPALRGKNLSRTKTCRPSKYNGERNEFSKFQKSAGAWRASTTRRPMTTSSGRPVSERPSPKGTSSSATSAAPRRR